jgi:hypothetical protein
VADDLPVLVDVDLFAEIVDAPIGRVEGEIVP